MKGVVGWVLKEEKIFVNVLIFVPKKNESKEKKKKEEKEEKENKE